MERETSQSEAPGRAGAQRSTSDGQRDLSYAHATGFAVCIVEGISTNTGGAVSCSYGGTESDFASAVRGELPQKILALEQLGMNTAEVLWNHRVVESFVDERLPYGARL